ncbi:MAG: 2-hydroxyacyl-CoA dehydratase [Bacillota bacterium]
MAPSGQTLEKEPKKRGINRLKSMYPLRNKVDEAYLKSQQAIRDGKPTAWSMLNWWEGDVIMKSMGVEVVYPENYGAVAAATGVAQKYLDLSEADGFPTHMCGYARTNLGYTYRMMKELGGQIPPEAPLGGMPKPDILIGSGCGCDARFKWFQALSRYIDAPQWVLELPNIGVHERQAGGVDEYAIKFMVQELRDFVAFLEKLLQKKMDWDVLDKNANYTLEIHRVFHEINELRKAKPCPMHSCDFWSSMTGCLLLLGDPAEILGLYQDMYREVKERVDNQVAGIHGEEKFRLFFSELPPWHSLKFFEGLAERGWNFVVESHSYHPIVPLDLSGVSDPLEKIARISYQFAHSRHDQALNDKISNTVVDVYLEYAREYQCDGAFLHPLLSCRAASSNLKSIQDQVMKRYSIPSLYVEGDIVDIRLFNPKETMARAEAFEESMTYYRRLRAEQGLPW